MSGMFHAGNRRLCRSLMPFVSQVEYCVGLCVCRAPLMSFANLCDELSSSFCIMCYNRGGVLLEGSVDGFACSLARGLLHSGVDCHVTVQPPHQAGLASSKARL